MKAFSSLAAVVALWLGVSFSLWLVYRLFRQRDGSRQKQLSAAALGLVDESASVFSALRARASQSVNASGSYGWHSNDPREALQDDVRALLNAIEAKSSYFDRVKAAKKRIEKAFGLEDFAPLAEILQIRRDFWAASEIFLIEDIRALGAELSEPETYDTFRAEALALLFRDAKAAQRDGDPVALRLSIAREEAAAFSVHVEETTAAELEKGRAPTPAEIIAVPVNLMRSAAFVAREGRNILKDAAATAQSFARSVGAKGLKAAAEELRQARGDLPGQFANAFERAGGLARKGGDGLKRHYEFVLEAQELRARYAELLAHAPIVTEKGKQFLARLELEKRAEQFRESSGDAADWARQKVVVAIAYLIRGLQYVQAKITPQQNKQLAVLASAEEPARDPDGASDEPFRVLLLPSSSYAGGNHGRGNARSNSRTNKSRRATAERETPCPTASASARPASRLRDVVTGETSLADYGAAVTEAPRPRRARSAAVRQSSSLLDRLSSVDDDEQAGNEDLSALHEEPAPKRRSFGLFKSARN